MINQGEFKDPWNVYKSSDAKGHQKCQLRGSIEKQLVYVPEYRNNRKWQEYILKKYKDTFIRREILKERLRHSIEYRNWRKAILERDIHTCRCCGKKSRRLAVCHLVPYWIIVNQIVDKYIKDAGNDFNLLYRRALQYEMLLNVENGLTACRNCHSRIHEIQWTKPIRDINSARRVFKKLLRNSNSVRKSRVRKNG